MSKQTSLFKCGFKRKVQHRNKLLELKDPDFVPDVTGVLPCEKCGKRFKSKQGLSMHVVWAHLEGSSSHGSVAKISWKLEARVEQDVKAVTQ